MSKYLVAVIILILTFQAVVFATNSKKSAKTAAPFVYSNCTNASEAALERFKEGLRIPTVCWSTGNYNRTALVELRDLINRSRKFI